MKLNNIINNNGVKYKKNSKNKILKIKEEEEEEEKKKTLKFSNNLNKCYMYQKVY